jgi:phage tail-like protein
VANPLPLPKQRARFRVIIPGSSRAGATGDPIVTLFATAGPLAIRIRKGSRRHGGSPIPFTWPAGVEHADITLTAGSVNDLGLFNWAVEAAMAAAGIGTADTDHQRDVTIEELDRAQTAVNRWRLLGAWPTDYVGANYDNNSNRYLIQSLTLTYHTLRIVHPDLRDDATDTRFLVTRV